eukprot:scaffold15439_cov95-Isochrysis_galbana.AAC.6
MPSAGRMDNAGVCSSSGEGGGARPAALRGHNRSASARPSPPRIPYWPATQYNVRAPNQPQHHTPLLEWAEERGEPKLLVARGARPVAVLHGHEEVAA